MNVRRINATKNSSVVLKAVILFLLIFVWMLVSTQNSSCPKKTTLYWKVWQKTEKIPMSNYTCEEIYLNSLNDTLYKDNKQKKYEYNEVFLYYLKNCVVNKTNESNDN